MGTMLSSGEAMAVQTNSLVDSSLKEPNPMAEGKLRVAPVQTIIDAENDLQTNFPAKKGGRCAPPKLLLWLAVTRLNHGKR